MKLALPRLFRRRATYARSSTRYTCQIDGQLMLMDRMITFDGRVLDLSAGGAMFRPKLAYLMQRRDVPVCLMVGDEEVFGQIVATTPAGFSIRFDEQMDEADIVALIDRHCDLAKAGGQKVAA